MSNTVRPPDQLMCTLKRIGLTSLTVTFIFQGTLPGHFSDKYIVLSHRFMTVCNASILSVSFETV